MGRRIETGDKTTAMLAKIAYYTSLPIGVGALLFGLSVNPLATISGVLMGAAVYVIAGAASAYLEGFMRKPKDTNDDPLVIEGATLNYKGYTATLGVERDTGVVFGRVSNTKDIITFQGNTFGQAIEEFHNSVEDYIDFCRELEREPNKPNDAAE